MKRIGIFSDTHGLWDDRYMIHFAECDEVWHAGDVGDYAILERIAQSGVAVRAVAGNVDTGMVRRKCPELDIFTVEGVKVLLTHVGGYPGRWSPGMKTLLRENGIQLMVDGHSHILKVMYDRELGLLHVNPGAAGNQGWQKVRTLIRLVLDEGNISDCEVIELAKEVKR